MSSVTLRAVARRPSFRIESGPTRAADQRRRDPASSGETPGRRAVPLPVRSASGCTMPSRRRQEAECSLAAPASPSVSRSGEDSLCVVDQSVVPAQVANCRWSRRVVELHWEMAARVLEHTDRSPVEGHRRVSVAGISDSFRRGSPWANAFFMRFTPISESGACAASLTATSTSFIAAKAASSYSPNRKLPWDAFAESRVEVHVDALLGV